MMNAEQPTQQHFGEAANNNPGGERVDKREEEDKVLQLRRTELERALAIKQAVEQDMRIHHKSITDFDYVQWSLTTGEDSLEVVVEKVYLMQCFRDEYKIQTNSVLPLFVARKIEKEYQTQG